MGTVCEVCGDIGFKDLMICCKDCDGSPTHQYCLDEVLFDASSSCWYCYECQQRHGEVVCSGPIDKVSSERQQCYNFGSTVNQPVTKECGSSRGDAAAGRIGKRKLYKKFKSLNKIYSPEKNSPRKKCTKKKSTVGPLSDFTNRNGCDSTSIERTRGKVLHSCQTIGTETAKSNNGGNRQVNIENSVRAINNAKQPSPVIVNCLGYKLGDIDLTKMRRDRKSKKTSESVTSPLKGFVAMETNGMLRSKNVKPTSSTFGRGNSVIESSGNKLNCMNSGVDSSLKPRGHDNLINHSAQVGCKSTKVNSVEDNRTSVGAHQSKYQVHDGNGNVIDDLALEREDEEVRSQRDCRASTELQKKIIAANVTQPSSLQNSVVNKVMPHSSNNSMLSKEKNSMLYEHIAFENRMEYQSEPSKFILADSATEEESSDAFQNFGKNNPKKRRKLILLDDDDDDDNEENKAVDVQPENVSSQLLKYDGPMTKLRVDNGCHAEAAVLTGDFSNQSPNNGRTVKKQRRYIDANKDEDEEAVVGAANSDFALNDVTNCALNDGTELASETVVAIDHCLQSRIISNSESADLCIYPQPADDPVWSGAFKVNSEVSIKMDAHLSNIACQEVWEFSKSLQPESVLEAKKLPWLHVLPKRWKSSGPTDDCIGLYFFPHTFRANEVSNELATEMIKSDSALKVKVGIADLLIFPSTILPEQNHLYQGKQYLWGVFKQRKALPDKGVVDREQDGSACATEESKRQEQSIFDQQDGSACASEEGELQEEHLLNQRDLEEHKPSDQETNVMDHVENQQPLVECNAEAQMKAMKSSIITEDFTLPGYSLSHAKPNSPIAGSNCSMSSERMNQQDGTSYSPEFNGPSAAEPSAEGDHRREQSCSGAEPPTTKLFGIIIAQTPRAQQLFQELASEGAVLLPVQEDNSGGVASGMNPDYQHLLERCQPLDFMSTGLDERPQPPDGVASDDSCLELFPARQEQIRGAPGPGAAEASSIDLELSLAVPSRPNLPFQL